MKLQLIFLLSLFFASPGLAKSKGDGLESGEGVVNKLLAPGPLMSGHKDLEHGDCLKCHDAGQGVPDGKCLDCHVAIKKSIQEKKSFHGLAKGTCIACHSDHKGRSNDTTQVNQKTFDHSKTSFLLHGAHSKITCAKCHTEKRTEKETRKGDINFFGLSSSCKECHKKDDVHFFPGKLAAKECSTCHNDVSWKNAPFDHKRETGYALIGSHAELSCEKCHAPHGKSSAKYEWPELPQKACLSCHADHHKDQLSSKFRGGKCEQCHSQTSWSIKHFEHKITGFALKGAHTQVACVDCHKQSSSLKNTGDKRFNFTGTDPACASCHKDYHGFREESSTKIGALKLCQTCHDDVAWHHQIGFNHNTQTSYPITGKHKGVPCFACHTPELGGKSKTPNIARHYEFPTLESKTCETCHKSPHENTPGSIFRAKPCTSCHSTDGWKMVGGKLPGFDHNKMTRFPLTGDHAKATCKSCHTKNGKEIYKFPFAEKDFCVNCHLSPHKKQFQEKFFDASCNLCHNSEDFKNQSKFDHNKADFKLTDAHTKIGQECTKCHIKTEKMLPVKPPHPAHKFQFPNESKGFCVECHRNVHKEQFSNRVASDDCRSCHNSRSFAELLPFDHDKTRFPLSGAHQDVKECRSCHPETDKFLPTEPPKKAGRFVFPKAETGFCESCHKNVHTQQFKKQFSGKPCRECHTTKDFEKRLPFDHDQTDFKLTGAHIHIRLKCGECHIKSEKMLPTQPPKPASLFLFPHAAEGYCEACHKNEHHGQFHEKFADQACGKCHTTSTFTRRKTFDHNVTRFVLKGLHLDLKCVECHEPTQKTFNQSPHHKKGRYIWEELLVKNCESCHKDVHNGRFGKQCTACHTEDGWDKTSGFHKNFQLVGVHKTLECSQCHEDRRELTGMGQDCRQCHTKDDVHRGQLTECASCHNQQFWSMQRFQHSTTAFPLRGAHRLMSCDSCHVGGVYQGKSSECVSCHREDADRVAFPNHKLPGFENCADCHNEFLFKGVRR